MTSKATSNPREYEKRVAEIEQRISKAEEALSAAIQKNDRFWLEHVLLPFYERGETLRSRRVELGATFSLLIAQRVVAFDECRRLKDELPGFRSAALNLLHGLEDSLEEVHRELSDQKQQFESALSANRSYELLSREIKDLEIEAENLPDRLREKKLVRDEAKRRYRTQTVFGHLFTRQFQNSSAYKGRGVAKSLDHWLAHVTQFGAAMKHYRSFDEIVDSLEDRLRRVSEALESKRALRADIESSARAESGLTALEAKHEQMESDVAAARASAERYDSDWQTVADLFDRYLTHGDNYTKRLSEILRGRFLDREVNPLGDLLASLGDDSPEQNAKLGIEGGRNVETLRSRLAGLHDEHHEISQKLKKRSARSAARCDSWGESRSAQSFSLASAQSAWANTAGLVEGVLIAEAASSIAFGSEGGVDVSGGDMVTGGGF